MNTLKDIFLVTKQVANYLGVSTSWLEKARGNQNGPAYHKVGAKVLYRTSDVEKWLESNRVTGGEADD